MKFRLFSPTPGESIIARLYGTIVAQARAPVFYQAYGVPDTVIGRLEMIMLHMVVVLERLEQEGPALRQLGQAVFDRFCRDMDENMREMGVGDLAVPRKMRRIGEAFYARQVAYRTALAAPEGGGQLVATLERNVFAGASHPAGAARLADYLKTAAERLARQTGFEQGGLVFPDPKEALHSNSARTSREWPSPSA